MMLSALLLAAMVAQPLPARLSVSIKPDQLTVGDRTVVTLNLTVPADKLAGQPRFPTWKESWGDARVLRAGPVHELSPHNGSRIFKQSVTLAAFTTGAVSLPQRQVAVPLRTHTVQVSTPHELALHVTSVLPPAEKRGERLAPKPPAPPRPLGLGAAFWWAAGIGSALILAALLLLYRRNRASAREDLKQPGLPPLAELKARLAVAARETDLERLHTAVSFALRSYLGRVLPFAACDRTTREIRSELRSRRLPEPWVRSCVRLLLDCDQVKFARRQEDRSVADERLDRALAIGQALESRLRPAATKVEKSA